MAQIFYTSTTSSGETQLWTSNGSQSQLLMTFTGSNITDLTTVGDKVFFTADDGTHGQELWKSDGTVAGTVMVRDIFSGPSSSNPANLTNVDGELFFTADDGAHGVELWKSDGTVAGTVLVDDIDPGAFSSSPSDLTNVNGTLYFLANDGTNGVSLWKSDGTAVGTTRTPFLSNYGSTYLPIIAAPNGVFFATETTTVPPASYFETSAFLDFYSGSGGSDIRVSTSLSDEVSAAVELNGELLFSGSGTYTVGQTQTSVSSGLWKTDGVNTSLVTNLGALAPSGDVISPPFDLVDAGTIVYFETYYGPSAFGPTPTPSPGPANYPSEFAIWETDGRQTQLITQFPDAEQATNLTASNGLLYYNLPSGLWVTDGTAEGTLQLSSNPAINLTDVGGTLFFEEQGSLWKTNGTVGTTVLVASNVTTSAGIAAVTLPILSVSNDATATRGQTIALSSLVTVSDPGHVGYQTLQLWDSAGTVGGGEFLINGVAQTGGHAINVPPGANVVFDVGTLGGTDTLWAQLIQDNGTTSGWQEITVTAPVARLPTLMVTSDNSGVRGQTIALSSLVTISDPDSVGYQKLELWDSKGTPGGGQFVVNGASQTGGHEIDVLPGTIPGTAFDVGTMGGTDTLWARLLENDGTLTAWQQFTVTAPPARIPTLNVMNDSNATGGEHIALSNLVTVSDPDSVGYEMLELWDSDGTAAGGEFLINGVAQTGGHTINVPSGANVVFEAGTGSGTDTIWAQLIQDNGSASGWEQFTVTVPAPTMNMMSVPSTTAGAQIALSSLVTVSDPSNATYQLQLWDSDGTAAGGEFLINGVAQTGGHTINVPSGANVVFDAGTGSGTDTLWAQLVQGNSTASGWEQFTVTVPAPTMSVTSVPSATAGAQIALSSLVSVSDPSNATYQLQLWDSDGTAAGGEFLINGVAQTGGHAINVPAGANVVFDAGLSAGTDTLWAQLVQNDGTTSGWQEFTVTVPNPALTVHNDTTATPAQVINLSTLVTISDPGHVGYQQLELWDSNGTAATGQFVVNGAAQTGGHEIDVSPANVANTVFDEGTSGASDTLWARLLLNNGTLTPWEQFTVVDPVTVDSGTTLELTQAYAGEAIFAGNSGTLQLDDSTGFSGTVSGMTGADTLDLRDIGFGNNNTLSYAADTANAGGTLSVGDGTHLAQIDLVGQYPAASFAVTSDGHGGTLIGLQTAPLAILSGSQHA